MRRILIVEDERDIVKHLKVLLEEEGFSVTGAATRAEAQDALERQPFDLILLDLMLPDGSGYALCTEIRRREDTPVIFLTAMDDEASIVTGFDLGADDYITKPFKPMELVSRVKNSLRRSGRAQSVFQLGGLSVDTAGAAVRRDGQEVVLSALEYRLLLTLLNHQGEVLSRSRLLQEIWDAAGDFVNDNTLTVYIKRLREKIEADPADPQIIKTVRGLGYKVEG
ncbi:DNA-binding response regulator, OmpR family, contains REC and winged-helix (wHTH) domain [Eubacterium maltosivorans]|uniref:response regulator transcription factor n=1 Tax=Eubacterium maltosivorans TaxID=2041044 RepID=UPI0008903081|nr:response regulator transcription factor [Eubacterium maltosivorans]WPK80578.1 Sensory transduction protein regX3 [Eubacterium maltosivorans]SDO22772.1 DNA-binding response regulator, OmpR family, contains REC and winged-helix (wHTH) domain [Eubacterium maltosivorans]